MTRLVHFAPGDEAAARREHASCAKLGPLHVDLGTSYQMRRPVVEVIGERFPRTFFLALAAVFVQVLVGVGLGVVAAVKRNTAWDYGAMTFTLLGISAPTFLTGIL